VRPGAERELFVNIERGDSMIIYSLKNYKAVRRFPIPAGAHNFIFSKGGERLWLMCGANGIFQVSPENGKTIRVQKLSSPVRGLAFIGNDILASCNNEIYILSDKDLSVKKHFANPGTGQILYSTAGMKGKLIVCPAVYDRAVLIIEAASGKILARLHTDKTPIHVQARGRYAFVSHAQDRHITKIDLKKKTVAGNIDIEGTNGLLIIR
jgi:hypothetical protein